MIRIRVNSIYLYFLGQILLSLGVVLVVKADFGITVATSVAYVLSRQFTSITFGTFNYIVQGAVFIIMLLNLKEIRLKYFMSFLTAVLFGFLVDAFTFLLDNLVLEAYYARIPLFMLSILLICLGVASFIMSKMPLMPFDIFVKKMAEKYNIIFGKFKIGFDISNFCIAAVLSFIFFGRLLGVYFGTLASAILIGPGIQLFLNYFDRYVEVEHRFHISGVF